MAILAQADRPKSVRNRYVIVVFGGVLCIVTLPFGFSVGVGAFVIGLIQISFFFNFVQTSRNATTFRALSPLMVSRYSYSPCS